MYIAYSNFIKDLTEMRGIPLRTIMIFCVALTIFLHVYADKKKIIVFISKGGGAHMSAAQAIKDYLAPEYDISIINPFIEITQPVDPIVWWTNGKSNCEDFFNSLNCSESMNSIRLLCKVGAICEGIIHNNIETLFENFFLKTKPDAVILVMPFFNGILYRVAQKLAIPFLIVSPELDTDNYCRNLYNPTYKNFFYCIPLDSPEVRSKFKQAHIPDDRVKVVGFPTRASFLNNTYDVPALKKEFGLSDTVPVVSVLMGGAGSRALMRYAKRLAKMDFPLQVVFCVGKNEAIREKIESLPRDARVSFTTVGFTDRMNDYMAVSDVLIAKPGPTGMIEALYSNLPLILDRTYKVMYTEYINIDFVEKNEVGVALRSMKHLKKTLKRFIFDTDYRHCIKDNIACLELPDFKTNIRNLMKEIFALPSSVSSLDCK